MSSTAAGKDFLCYQGRFHMSPFSNLRHCCWVQTKAQHWTCRTMLLCSRIAFGSWILHRSRSQNEVKYSKLKGHAALSQAATAHSVQDSPHDDPGRAPASLRANLLALQECVAQWTKYIIMLDELRTKYFSFRMLNHKCACFCRQHTPCILAPLH